MTKRRYAKDADSINPNLIKDEVELINKTIIFHLNLVKDLQQKLWDIRRNCMHEYDNSNILDKNPKCAKCGLGKLEPYQFATTSRDEYIAYSKKLKEVYLRNCDKSGLDLLKSFLEDKNLEDSTFPTIDKL